MQPFDERNFEPGALVPGGVWSFDRVTLRGSARARRADRAGPRPFLAGPLPALAAPLIDSRPPRRGFVDGRRGRSCGRRLGITVTDYADEVQDALPVELDGLGTWGVGQRLLDARLAGAESRPAALAEIAAARSRRGCWGSP